MKFCLVSKPGPARKAMSAGARIAPALMLWSLMAAPAQAYIGPGAGLGALVAVVATVVGLLLLFVGAVWFPIRRAMRNRKRAATEKTAHDMGAE